MGERYRELSALVRGVRYRWRAMTALRAWSPAAAAAALVIGLALATDRLLGPQGGTLVALWTVAAIAVLAGLARMFGPLRRVPRDLQVARLIEERCPELEDALVTAMAGRDADQGPMAEAVVSDAVNRTRDLDIDRIISRRTLRQAGLRAAAATIAFGVLGVLAAGPAGRAAGVAALYLIPQRLTFEVAPGDVKIREREPLRIVARIPGLVGLTPVLRVGNGVGTSAVWREVSMESGTDGFAVAFDRVEETFRYLVTAGHSSSREFTVTVMRPPGVERIDLRYEYPPVFGMQPREEQDGGDIYAPAGTRVRITVYPNKAVAQASLNLMGGRPIALTARGGTLEGELTITDDGSYRVALADAEGLTNPEETEYFIRTLDDRPPDVRITRPASDRQVTSIEEVPIEARAEDDFGVASLELVYAVRGGQERAVPFERQGSGLAVTGRRIVYLEDLGVQPGDFVTYYARARDVSRGKRPTEARSDIFFLEVTPFEEEFVASQSQGSGSAEERSVEEMAQAQKDIITATWTLDRRGRDAGARSREDVRTIATAQRELRARAVMAMTQMTRVNNFTRRRNRPGQAAADSGAESMRKAIEAMGLAQQELDAVRTSTALPHEMEALNELLRAQADVRQRVIQQQQASGRGGPGANRPQQDLSSLFDRELARQQQTNYETPKKSETRPDTTSESETLEKIRELARRQGALNQEQQELAKKQDDLPQPEVRRELERLTREQNELRRQAEDLARQLQQEQQRQSGQSGRSGRSGEAGRDLQQISEDMQGAASELRRDNPEEASARSGRAAERLRDLEQRMRSSQPDDRRRALGELQLESRQLADGQRRLSNEGPQQSAGTDSARRRALEQERLADRTERVEQAVRQLAGAPGDDQRERHALSEAAREVEQQRPSERMRNAARAEQSGQPQQQAAAKREGEEIARTLDRLADTLGAANGQSDESQRLTEELSTLRDLREQLAALDRQLAELRDHPDGQPQNGRGGQQNPGGQAGDQQQPWEQARELLGEMQREKGLDLVTPTADGFNPGRSAPGTEAWKQDFANWDTLKVQLATALERAEKTAAARLRDQQSRDRLNAGATQSVPEQYRRLVEKYFRALASGK